MFSLQGKTAMITGASGGLGEQFARTLSTAGARVILVSRRINKLESLRDELGNAVAMQMDVSQKQSVKSCFVELEQAGEKIDICINNAGIAALTPIFEEDNQEEFESIIQTNLLGVWYVIKAVANQMKHHHLHGAIINIGSVNEDMFSYKEVTAYAVSKAAVMPRTKSLATEFPKRQSRINTINPGPVQSDLLGSPNKHDADFWKDKIPAVFMAYPSDLDGMLLYLASNQASRYVTGVAFTIDGGLSCRSS
ncbi:MAG: 3-ketoacyl-ACP reductase [Alphaproteobacteria bacterium 40-19]|nr:MAG: 3-ketoacyl-ACP reductase [Alphaproteobacteria bacterium 40-19]